MWPILIEIPLSKLNEGWPNLPIYGYGLMLFFAFVGCNWLAQRLSRREGIDPKLIPDMAICLFVCGIIGGRIVYVIQYWKSVPGHVGFDGKPFWDVIKLWDGGLVLYGALFGGAAVYFGY